MKDLNELADDYGLEDTNNYLVGILMQNVFLVRLVMN